jgi:hypothetical protein
MITVRVIDLFNHTLNYSNIWDFEEYYYPHRLINNHYVDDREINKMERLLFIANLKYDIYFTAFTIYMYNIKEVDKYLQVLRMIYINIKFEYKRDEVIEFFEG